MRSLYSGHVASGWNFLLRGTQPNCGPSLFKWDADIWSSGWCSVSWNLEPLVGLSLWSKEQMNRLCSYFTVQARYEHWLWKWDEVIQVSNLIPRKSGFFDVYCTGQYASLCKEDTSIQAFRAWNKVGVKLMNIWSIIKWPTFEPQCRGETWTIVILTLKSHASILFGTSSACFTTQDKLGHGGLWAICPMSI